MRAIDWGGEVRWVERYREEEKGDIVLWRFVII